MSLLSVFLFFILFLIYFLSKLPPINLSSLSKLSTSINQFTSAKPSYIHNVCHLVQPVQEIHHHISSKVGGFGTACKNSLTLIFNMMASSMLFKESYDWLSWVEISMDLPGELTKCSLAYLWQGFLVSE